MDRVCITVYFNGHKKIIETEKGSNLRKVLIKNGCSPYSTIGERFNCGGNGICAMCGVWITQHEPKPNHWHDWIAKKSGYSRLSCQITIEAPLEIQIDENKTIWGKPKWL